MPPRPPFSLDLCRTSYVCQSCVANLRNPNPLLWLGRSSSTASRRGGPRQGPLRAPARGRPTRPSRTLRPKSAAGAGAAGTNPDIQKAFAKALAENAESILSPDDAADGAASGGAKGITSSDPDIRFFDADETGQMQQLRDSKEFGAASGGLDAEIEKTITELETQMENTIEMLRRMEEEGDPDKAEELRKQFKKTLRDQYKGRVGLEAEDYKALHIPGFSGSRQRPVAALNRFLARESIVRGGVPKKKDLLECWKTYSSARKTLSTSWDSVPREVWDFLWTTMSWESIDNPNRMNHIYVLTKDMTAAGITLRSSQQLLAIEAMFIEGWQAEAIESWKKAVVTLGSKPEAFTAYWELGVRMCCLHGDTDRAQRAVDTLLSSEHQSDPRILLFLISALAAKDNTLLQAWESYQRMRTLLGPEMKIEDYDDVIASFLTANRVEDAMQIFVDMMFSGPIDVRGKKKLPVSVANQFFIGKWLKRLIGAGQLDGAYKVVTYLRTRGVVPSPVQLNGLIGAWMRTETAENLEKADRLAWDMIRSRLSYVRLRRRGELMQHRVSFYDPVKSSDPDELDGAIKMGTRASPETFGLLAENYCSRRLHDRLKQLLDILEQAELSTSTFIMNQVIKSYKEENQPEEAVNFYRDMTENRGVQPNSHTYLYLFRNLGINRIGVEAAGDPEILDSDLQLARQLFTDMVEHEWKFDGLDTFKFLPRTVLFSMLKLKDFTGMIVAGRAMRALFDFVPPEALLIELATGVVNLRVRTEWNLEYIMGGSVLIQNMIQRHRDAMVRAGNLDPDEGLTTEQRTDELSATLESLVLFKAGAQKADRRDVEALVEEAAREMGMYDIIIERDEEKVRRLRKIFGRHVYREESGKDDQPEGGIVKINPEGGIVKT